MLSLVEYKLTPDKRLRYNGFFIESSCAVLLYDSLSNKHTYLHNLEYIKAGLQSLDSMVAGEPIPTARASIQRILGVFQRKLVVPRHADIQLQPQQSSSTFAAFAEEVAQQARQAEAIAQVPATTQNIASDSDIWEQNMSQMDWGFDVYTTDLGQFFPVDDSYGLTPNHDNGIANPHQYLEQRYYREPF